LRFFVKSDPQYIDSEQQSSNSEAIKTVEMYNDKPIIKPVYEKRKKNIYRHSASHP